MKISKRARDFILDTLRENGSMSTDDAIELVRPHYDFDASAAREREMRRYVGRLMSHLRDDQGTRTTFLEKDTSTIVNLERCDDLVLVSAVESQLRVQAIGMLKSCRKAARRKAVLKGQVTLFDDLAFSRELSHTAM